MRGKGVGDGTHDVNMNVWRLEAKHKAVVLGTALINLVPRANDS